MITIPNSIKKIRDLEADFGTTIAQAIWQEMARALNYLNLCYPVGMCMWFHASQANLPGGPDARFWQLCDGSTVTNSASPMFGQALPNVAGRFVRQQISGEGVYSTGGVSSINLSHNHSGNTQFFDTRATFQMDDGDDRISGALHRHSIATSSLTLNTIPPYKYLQMYCRVA